MDVPAGVTQEEGHTGLIIHLESAVHAFIFIVDREVELCVLTIESFPFVGHFIFIFFSEEKIKNKRVPGSNSRSNVAGIQVTTGLLVDE